MISYDSYLDEIVREQKRGTAVGIASICSANHFVIESAFQQALDDHSHLLIEATCNQVNQDGGYTGMTPNTFVASVHAIARQYKFPLERLILGGDHLGPNPWRAQSSEEAMDKARVLVRAYVLAGFSKIHLDASMKCADDALRPPLEKRVSAARAAELALAAETAHALLPPGSVTPRYVIGTEVPAPGGALAGEDELTVTTPEDAAETIDITRDAFRARGLQAAWERVVAVVVQPGVEFGDTRLSEYDRSAASDLVRFIKKDDRLLFEAHSTDYQKREALRALVEDQFALLKVGPALTFAFREGVFALAAIEEELSAGQRHVKTSRVRERLDEAMLSNAVYWQKHYQGDARALRLARKYSFSDRSRYYWPVPEVQSALSRLLQNLGQRPLPLTFLSQYLPIQYARIRDGKIANQPRVILLDKVRRVLADYSYACGYLTGPA